MLWKEWIKRGFGYQMGTYLAMATLAMAKVMAEALNEKLKKDVSETEKTKTE